MARGLLMRSVVRTLTTSALLVALVLLGAGCRSGVLSVRAMGDGGGVAPDMTGDGGTPMVSASELFTTTVEPMLVSRCGGCHGPDRVALDFLRPSPDVRTTLLSYPALVDLESPASSRLLTKGEHSGPALATGEADLVRTWIEREAAEGTMVEPTERELATTPTTVREGFNALPLDALGLPGTSLHFVAARVGAGMLLDSVQIAAGPMGARVVHPVFVTWIEGAPVADPIDRFAGVEIEVEPNSTRAFDTGTVVITELPEGALLSVHFDEVSPLTGGGTTDADGGMPMPAEGCTQLAAFREMAQPQLTTYCTRCHGGGNASATAGMDMTRVGATDDATLLLGCNQVLGRISPTSPSASGLFTQPDPATGGGHDFKFGTSGELERFRAGVLGWFEMEAP